MSTKARVWVKIERISADKLKIKTANHGTKSMESLKDFGMVQINIKQLSYVETGSVSSHSDQNDVPRNGPLTGDSTDTIQEMAANFDRHYTRVKLDPYHWLARVTTTLDQKHGAFLDFSRSLRDALFVVDEADFLRVSKVLEADDQKVDEVWDASPDWILQYVRRRIPEPQILSVRLQQVFDKFADIKDPQSSEPLFDSNMGSVIKNAMKHVAKGCLSDPPAGLFKNILQPILLQYIARQYIAIFYWCEDSYINK